MNTINNPLIVVKSSTSNSHSIGAGDGDHNMTGEYVSKELAVEMLRFIENNISAIELYVPKDTGILQEAKLLILKAKGE